MAKGGSVKKRFKAALKKEGIIGPTLSKKQKRDGTARTRQQREGALQRIREEFNPFDFKQAKPAKFPVTSNRSSTAASSKGRPGLAKASAEERVCFRDPTTLISC